MKKISFRQINQGITTLMCVFCLVLVMIVFFKKNMYIHAEKKSQMGVEETSPTKELNFIKYEDANKLPSMCRSHAMKIWLKLADPIEKLQVDKNEISFAQECWQKDLVFYLSYPMDFAYGSHVLPLLASVWVTEGPILEFGSGWYSTPMLHRIGVVQNRFILTADSNFKWLSFFQMFQSDFHDLYLINTNTTFDIGKSSVEVVQSWDEIGKQSNWTTILIDHAPGYQRYTDLERLQNNADIILVHDTDELYLKSYGQKNNIFDYFKHRYTFAKSKWSQRYSDALSNKRGDLIDVIQLLCEYGLDILKDIKGA